MRALYVVRHASPAVQPNTPSEHWTLSERGVAEARALANIAAGWGLAAVYSSIEPKAQATALLVGDAASQPVRVVDGFQELRFDRWVPNSDAFSELVRNILEQPAVSAHGAETAADAAARFEAGVRIVAEGPFPAAVVSHGRILTAYLAQLLHLEDPFSFWRAIAMPAWASVDLDAAPPKLTEGFRGLAVDA